MRLLAQGELDLALVILPLQTRDPALATTAFLREPLVVAAPADGSLVRARSLRVRDLAHHPLVMFREGYDMRTVTLAACRRERIEPRIAVEGGELDAVLAFVEAGLGVAVVPSMVVEDRPELRRVPFGRPACRARSHLPIDVMSTFGDGARVPLNVARVRRRRRPVRSAPSWGRAHRKLGKTIAGRARLEQFSVGGPSSEKSDWRTLPPS